MNGWTVELRPEARRELRQLEEGPRAAALELIEDLEEDGPAQIPAIRLRSYHDTWRVRFHHERYRMIYQVSVLRKRIVITRIRPRPTAYEGLRH